MPVEEFEFDAYHIVEARATLINVVVAAATAIELTAGSLFGDADCGADRCHRILFGDDEQDRAANGGGTSHRSAPREAQQRPRSDTITPFG